MRAWGVCEREAPISVILRGAEVFIGVHLVRVAMAASCSEDRHHSEREREKQRDEEEEEDRR